MNRLKITLAVLLIFISNFELKAQDSTSSEAIKYLTQFYTNYIKACDQSPMKIDELDKLKASNFTKELINKLDEIEIYYDPILNAQDCSLSSLKTLTIKTLDSKQNTFIVTYAGYNEPIEIRLTLQKENSSFKISSIIGVTNK